MNLFEQAFRILSALLSTFTLFHLTFNIDGIFKASHFETWMCETSGFIRLFLAVQNNSLFCLILQPAIPYHIILTNEL